MSGKTNAGCLDDRAVSHRPIGNRQDARTGHLRVEFSGAVVTRVVVHQNLAHEMSRAAIP